MSALPETSTSQNGMKPTLFWPPGNTMSRYASPIGRIGKIAFRCGGRCAAVKSWVIAR